jgi:phosphonoacetate hydrolase
MNAKTRMDASPNVIYLQDLLDAWIGAGPPACTANHRSLRRASRSTRFLRDHPPRARCGYRGDKRTHLRIARYRRVLSRAEAAARWMPADRIGDLVVTATRSVVISGAAARLTFRTRRALRSTAACPSSRCH